MKQIFILVFKNEKDNPIGFFDRKEMAQNQADNLNIDLTEGLIWILTPNY